ncbi:SapC family protein [Aliiglaciecola sp. 3_MG-2023]|uniref:SapC family protein n=1 Tax=Aliiglaciecola sp. 3_MG-2023 TaxID=3062644 RepID=UPI0026E2E189|nr:SapC family protein [Aliiglaciecola sp. 3_MG-2023]MDO6693033.1 SapC family protein [Aliiglaciecola sp. 3_MG-2023]
MAKHVLLNNVHHKNVRVLAHYAKEFADDVASVLVFPPEFVELQKEYPIFFQLDKQTIKYQCVAILGLQKDENLFLNNLSPLGWHADYIPAMMERGPFLIGFQQQDPLSDPSPVIHIDMQHPKVSNEKGQPLFLEHGGNSPYLNHVATRLQAIHEGMAIQDKMFDCFQACDLIEPVNIEFDLINGEKCKLTGNFTINEEKLRALSAEQLFELNQLGYLQFAYAAIASVTNIRKLVERKNALLT